MANYVKYTIWVNDEEQGEILTAYLADFPFESFDYEDGVLNAYIPQSEAEACRADIERMLEEEGYSDYRFEDIKQQNWNAVWESDFEEVEVGGKVLIRAPFHAPRPEFGEFEVVIQPKMSFGTGHHATTQMMVEMMLETELRGKRILDMGSGTGVLAIVAARLGAESILAVEIDDMAEESVRENIALNGVEDRVVSVCGDAGAIAGEEFDVVLANINRNILLNDMATYVATLRQGGKLIISGFLAEDIAPLVDYASTLRLEPIRQRSNGEWRCVAFELR
ncbi:MAG: 50S ribosomal protein L11 methyltransferase [Rikenellaceae bacterium]|nr:50S ribosomal protein L11 methyltransferase [Rikenellaceae bacterium]